MSLTLEQFGIDRLSLQPRPGHPADRCLRRGGERCPGLTAYGALSATTSMAEKCSWSLSVLSVSTRSR